MKSFKITWEYEYDETLSRKEKRRRAAQHRRDRCKAIYRLYKQATDYVMAHLGMPSPDGGNVKGRLGLWKRMTIVVADDRDWCKRLSDDGHDVMETVIELRVLTHEEVLTMALMRAMSVNSVEEIAKKLKDPFAEEKEEAKP